ncbi:hypothetical protein Dimus_004090, partial [Dionaea muscipula]
MKGYLGIEKEEQSELVEGVRREGGALRCRGSTPSSLSTELVNYRVNHEHAAVVIVVAGGSVAA